MIARLSVLARLAFWRAVCAVLVWLTRPRETMAVGDAMILVTREDPEPIEL